MGLIAALIGALALVFLFVRVGLPWLRRAPNGWSIGPVIDGRNISVGMPSRPKSVAVGGFWCFAFPRSRASHVHYVDRDTGKLTGAIAVLAHVLIEATADVRFVPQELPELPATMALMIQRSGDDWSGSPDKTFHRAYSRPRLPLSPGWHALRWQLTADQMMPVSPTPDNSFDPASIPALLDNAVRIGLVFGSEAGAGHGVYADGPATFTLVNFIVEYADGRQERVA